MTPEHSPDLVGMLESSARALNEAAAGISDADAVIKPGEGRWSVLDCLEHVAFVEERFLGRIANAQRLETNAASRAAELSKTSADREHKLQAPDAVHPTGRYTSVAHALEVFNSVRARSIEVARTRSGELPRLSVEHPRFGTMNGSDVLVVAAGHAGRHAEQIREIRALLARRG